MKKIKVNLSIDSHSTGRGIGFYAHNLKKALAKVPDLELTDQHPDLIHYPYFDLFYPTLKITHTPTIVTLHDLTPLVLSSLYPKGLKGSINLWRQSLALKKATAIITDSQNSKIDIINYLHIPSQKIHVIPLAVDPIYSTKLAPKQLSQIKQKYSLPDKFVLYVGGVNPNKNLPRLIQACLDLNLKLILVGSEFTQPLSLPVHPELKDLQIIQKSIQQHDSIHAPGFVSNEDLVGIYQLASVYCQPSLYEGFGLPLLEAMTAGCPIISSHSSSLPEIYPANTITFDPENQLSLNKALEAVLKLSPKQKLTLVKLGQARAKDFSWAKTAELTTKVYRSI